MRGGACGARTSRPQKINRKERIERKEQTPVRLRRPPPLKRGLIGVIARSKSDEAIQRTGIRDQGSEVRNQGAEGDHRSLVSAANRDGSVSREGAKPRRRKPPFQRGWPPKADGGLFLTRRREAAKPLPPPAGEGWDGGAGIRGQESGIRRRS
jgi:hypothetical protein